MSIAYAEFETATRSEFFSPRNMATQSTLLHCLVVAEDAQRREFFQAAAETAGWQVAVFADANSARNAANRVRHSLVIVDLAGAKPESSSALRVLAEQLSTDSRRLLIVCGSDGNPLEEIWARQLGVWLYLSGVDLSCDVTLLCSEARQVADKLAPSVKPAYARTA
jgi:DNA-binding NtrC family response regulator